MGHSQEQPKGRWAWSMTQRSSLVLGLLAFAFAVFAFGLYGLQGSLERDDALYLYSGQLLARGIPPYVRCFDGKTPLATFWAGGAAYLAQCLRLDDVLTVRAAFLIAGSLAAAALCFLGRSLFASRRIGLLASLTLVAFRGFAKHAASGPRPKTLAVLWEILALWCTAERQWFAAGVCGGLAAWTWQPLVLLPLTSALVAVLQTYGNRHRLQAASSVVLGFLTPSALVSAYLYCRGAWDEFVQQTLIHPFTQLVPSRLEGMTILQRLQRLLNVLGKGYGFMGGAALLGAAASVWIVARHMRRAGGLRAFLSEDPLAGWAVSGLALLLYSLFDLQGYVDLYVLLPFVALSLAWLLTRGGEAVARRVGHRLLTPRLTAFMSCALLAGAAIGQYGPASGQGLNAQRRWAKQIAEAGGSGQAGWLLCLGRPEVLVLLQQTSAHPYVSFYDTIYEHIDAIHPGGFAGWLDSQLAGQPTTVVLGPMQPPVAETRTSELLASAGYAAGNVGNWTVFRWEPEVLAAPLDVQASDGTYGDRVQVTWMLVPGAVRYEVYRSGRLQGARQLVARTAAARFEDLTAESCRSMHYWIVACDDERCSHRSDPDAGYVGGSAPRLPTGVHLARIADEGQLRLTWQWPDGAESFLLYRGLPDEEGEPFAETRRARYVRDAVPGDESYQYWVEACNACGCSAPSRRTRARRFAK